MRQDTHGWPNTCATVVYFWQQVGMTHFLDRFSMKRQTEISEIIERKNPFTVTCQTSRFFIYSPEMLWFTLKDLTTWKYQFNALQK